MRVSVIGGQAKEDTWSESAATAEGFAASGWPPTLTDAEILEHLVALNAERAKEETSGLVRWLRPDYQNPGGAQPQQTALAVEVETEAKSGTKRAGKLAQPKTLSERVKAVSAELATVKEPVTAAEMAKRFARARAADVGEILETLCAMGKARCGHPPPSLRRGKPMRREPFCFDALAANLWR